MSRLARAALAAALLFPIAAPVRAGEPPAPPEIGSVVTSDRQDEPLSATARVTFVVTKAEMLRRGFTTVAAAIAGLPGVTVGRYGPAGAAATVSIRGSSGPGVLVLLDGRPVAGAQIGTVDLGAIPTTGVERIEVVEGSGATLYGSGAVGGIVNIITAHAAGRAPDAAFTAGSFGERSLSFESGPFAFERRIATGSYGYPGLDGAPGGIRTGADFAETALRARTDGVAGAWRYGADGGIVSRSLGVPGSTAFLTPFARQTDLEEDLRAGASLARGATTTALDLSATRTTLAYADPQNPPATLNVEGRLEASLRTVVAGDRSRFVAGLDLAHGVARTDGGTGTPAVPAFAQTALYAQESRAFGALRAYAGVRGERDGAAGAAITPSFGAAAALGAAATLRVNAATAFRVPTAEDLTYPGFSNPTLLPERSKSLDIDLDAARVLGGATIGWFVLTGSDLIVLNPAVDFSRPFGPQNEPLVNAQRASIAGFTAAVTAAGAAGFAARLALTDTYRAVAFDPTGAASRLPDRPVASADLDLGWTRPPDASVAGFGLALHAAGRRRDGNGSGAPYGRLDAYVRARLAPHAALALRGTNLTDARYSEIPTYPLPGRGFTLELTTR